MIKQLITGFILTGITMSFCQAQEVDCGIDKLNSQLIELYEKDQAIRKELMPVLGQYQKDGSGQMKLLRLAMQMEKQDKQNQQQVQTIIAQCGWPVALAPKAHNTLFLVLQHAPDELMKQHYPTVLAYARQGILEANDAATMFDRLQMRAGKYQRYGTQTFQDDQNRNLVWPIEEIESLNQRRDSVGLPSMEKYFQMAKDSIGVEMYWDKKLTLEKAIEMKKK